MFTITKIGALNSYTKNMIIKYKKKKLKLKLLRKNNYWVISPQNFDNQIQTELKFE